VRGPRCFTSRGGGLGFGPHCPGRCEPYDRHERRHPDVKRASPARWHSSPRSRWTPSGNGFAFTPALGASLDTDVPALWHASINPHLLSGSKQRRPPSSICVTLRGRKSRSSGIMFASASYGCGHKHDPPPLRSPDAEKLLFTKYGIMHVSDRCTQGAAGSARLLHHLPIIFFAVLSHR